MANANPVPNGPLVLPGPYANAPAANAPTANAPGANVPAANAPAGNAPTGHLGPHGYPLRFGVWEVYALRSSGQKIYSDDDTNLRHPVRFIEDNKAFHRRTLRASGHIKDNNKPLISIVNNLRTTPSTPPGQTGRNYQINLQAQNFNPPLGAYNRPYRMDHIRCRPNTFEFEFLYQNPQYGEPPLEFFQWRSAPLAVETRGLLSEIKGGRPAAAFHTGLPRPNILNPTPPSDSESKRRRGYVLVWANGPNRVLVLPNTQPPLGYTQAGEEIVASWAQPLDKDKSSRDRAEELLSNKKPLFYFQF
jgi:hypothetical protein